MLIAFALATLLAGPFSGPTRTERPGECSVAWQPYFSQYFEPNNRLGDQVWSFRQLSDGSMIVASSIGLTRIEGAEQERLSDGSGDRPVYSLDVDANDRVFFGAYRDFGVLEYDSTGTQVARSLLAQSGVSPDSISYVWTTIATPKRIIFQTPERLIGIEKGSARQWSAPGRIHNAFLVGQRVFVRVISKGLYELHENELLPTPGGEAFADLRIFLMHETPSGQLLIGTNEEGIYISNGSGFERVPSALDDIEPDVRRYHGVVLGDGKIAVATLGAGIMLISAEGEMIAHLRHETSNRYENPLKDDFVNFVFSDAHNGLWVGYNNAGVSRIDICSPLNKIEGIGGIRSIDEAGDNLYVSTGANVLVIDRKTGHLGNISEKLPWSVQECRGQVLVSSDNSLALYARESSGGRPPYVLDRYTLDDVESRPRVLRQKRDRKSVV